MSKKSKKRKRKKSSSSSEEDAKSSKKKDATKNCKSDKRKQDVKRSAAKKEKHASPTVKDVSQSTRQIKNPIYRLSKTRATDQKSVNKEEYRKPESVVVPLHREKCSSKAKHDISGKDNSVSGSKTVERGPSTPSNNAGTAPQRTEKTSKGSLDEKSSQRSSSKSKKQRISPSLVSTERKQDTLKRNCRAEEPPRTGNDSYAVKTRECSKTSSISRDSSWQKRAELFENMCQRHQENKVKRSPSREAKTHSASTTKLFSTSAKQTASASSSKLVKNVTTIPGKFIPVPYKTVKSSPAQQQICSLASPLPLKFKIQKKLQPRPVDSSNEKNDVKSTDRNLKHGTELSDSGASRSSSKQETVQQAPTCLDVTPSFASEEQNKRSSLSDQLPATSQSVTELRYDQMPVVEELHLARSEKRLEMNVMQSYGELTCMDIDPPEGAADTHCQQPPQQNLILVLDTNILLSHLDYVKQMQYHSLVLIPWVVLQELDCLKSRRGMPGSVAHLAIPAISYIYNCLKSRECHLRGQSMEQAAENIYGLNAENNDDRVLQCCLQYQSLYPECALILCTDDKNLCCKALVSGVKALSKSDLEAEIGRSRHGFHPPQNVKPPVLPHISPHVSLPVQSRRYSAVQPHCRERAGLFVEEKDNKQLSTIEDQEETKWDDSSVSELEGCLRDVLSDVLEVEMKAAYDELWLEIVYLKPPWTLQDVLRCFKKHWFAVFGHVVPRWMEQTVSKLIDFFNSGKPADCSAMSAAFQEAKELVNAFRKSSTLVPSAISIMDNIYNKLQQQSESPAGDVVMNDKDEDKQPAQVSHQEVWAVFENIWSYVFQLSLEVFRALGFDPHNMQSAQPVGCPPPPQDAVDCLHKLSSMVSQLIQAFSSVLSSPPGSEEVQMLLGIIHSTKIVDVDSRLTAKDFLDCFSQQDYREKLRVGGNQLMELKEALDRCAGTTGQYTTFTTLPC